DALPILLLDYKIKEPVDFWKTGKKYHKRLKENLQETTLFGTYGLYKTMTRAARFDQISQFKINDTPFISNVGLIPVPVRIGRFHVASAHIGANIGRNEIGLGLMTNNNHVDLAFLFDDRTYSIQQVAGLAQNITGIMEEAIKVPG
nr:hypothetical protein [Candidatus Sigynarchaeota archaeon]